MESFSPRLIVHVVVVITGRGYRRLVKLGISANRRGGHKATAGMTEYAHPIDINKRVAGSQLLLGSRLVREERLLVVP